MRRQAIRTLKIGELDDLDGRGRGSLCRALSGFHRLARRLERDDDARFGLEPIEVRLTDRPGAFLTEIGANRRPHLVQRRAAQAIFVGLIPRLDLGVGRRRDLARHLLLDELVARHAARRRILRDQRIGHELVERRSPRLVHRLGELGAAEIRGRLLQRDLIDLCERDRRRSDGRDDVGADLRLRLLGRGGARSPGSEDNRECQRARHVCPAAHFRSSVVVGFMRGSTKTTLISLMMSSRTAL